MSPNNILDELEENGFVVLRSAVSSVDVAMLKAALENHPRDATTPGVRCLLRDCEPILHFGRSFASHLSFAPEAHPVRGILFDKTPAANWYVTWHQDRTIPIAFRPAVDMDGYTAWSVKDGIHHVQPPAEILNAVLTARISLDDAEANSGAIKFIPGSHKYGLLTDEEIATHRDTKPHVEVATKSGDVILMRPLILHASSKSPCPTHRRVLHLEYASGPLPDPLQWGLA